MSEKHDTEACSSKKPIDYSKEDCLLSMNHTLERKEFETEESDKYMTVTNHTKDHARRRAKLQQQLVDVVVEHKDEIGEYAELVEDERWQGKFVPKLFKIL